MWKCIFVATLVTEYKDLIQRLSRILKTGTKYVSFVKYCLCWLHRSYFRTGNDMVFLRQTFFNYFWKQVLYLGLTNLFRCCRCSYFVGSNIFWEFRSVYFVSVAKWISMLVSYTTVSLRFSLYLAFHSSLYIWSDNNTQNCMHGLRKIEPVQLEKIYSCVPKLNHGTTCQLHYTYCNVIIILQMKKLEWWMF